MTSTDLLEQERDRDAAVERVIAGLRAELDAERERADLAEVDRAFRDVTIAELRRDVFRATTAMHDARFERDSARAELALLRSGERISAHLASVEKEKL